MTDRTPGVPRAAAEQMIEKIRKRRECDAELRLTDDHGDNDCTMRCRGLPGHKGSHREEFERGGRPVVVTWWIDERRIDLPPAATLYERTQEGT